MPTVFCNFGRIRKRLPVGKGLAPSGRECHDARRPWANPQPCSAFARVFLCRPVCCAERASPFPTMRRLRIRRRWRLVFGAAAEPDTGWTTFPTKRRFPCIDGDGECEEQDLRAFHVRLCGMDVFLTHSQARAVSHESKRTVPVDSFCPFRPKSPSKISPSPSICSCSPGADTV